MYVYTRMIFAAVLSPAIKIFHRHLGPNLLIFAVKVSPRKNTDQGDFLLKRAVRAVYVDCLIPLLYRSTSWTDISRASGILKGPVNFFS